ncbi:MAG: glycosyltransferase [Planctomycetes bacterium]|nr:glycosyltransferase [Planctomycetota bacterium]
MEKHLILHQHENESILVSKSFDDQFDDLEKAGLAKVYGNVHGYSAGTYYSKLITNKPSREIHVINLTQHPIMRIESLANEWFYESTFSPTMCRRLGNIHHQSEFNKRVFDYVQSAFPRVDLSIKNNSIFLLALLSVISSDFQELQIEGLLNVHMERLAKDVEYLCFIFPLLTQNSIKIEPKYLHGVISSGRKNQHSKAGRSSIEVYEQWAEWKRTIFKLVLKETKSVELYNYFGYDLSLKEKIHWRNEVIFKLFVNEEVSATHPNLSFSETNCLTKPQETHTTNNPPLASIVTICRNSERTIRRCIESVLSQDYANIEYIIQDGASTDRTLDIIKEYKDDRIKLVSEPDLGGPSEAYFKGLCRCTGDIIGLCWADEEYFPHTVSWGVTKLGEYPEAAAIYGDVYATDIDGNIPEGIPNPAPQWDLTKFLCWEIMPNYCSSFFRTSKLKDAGFFDHVNRYYNSKTEPKGCIMYDYYAMVGIKYPILYIPDFVAKFSFHKNQLSSTPSVLYSMIPELVRSFDHISNATETPDSIHALRYRAHAGFHLMMISSLLSNANAFEDAKTMLNRAISYEPDINFLNKVVVDACNYLNYKGLSNELLEFTDIIIKASLTFPNLHYTRAIALSDLGRYKDAIESIRKEHIIQPMHAGLYWLLFKIQLHMLFENQHVRGALNKGILAKYQLREAANILNNLLTTMETEGVCRFLQDMSSAALASLEDIVNACLSAASEEGTQELINRLKALAATIKAVGITKEQSVDVQ